MIVSTALNWPAGGTESVPVCPVCGGLETSPLHDGLADLTFNCAPGLWTMVRCSSCQIGYLNPRPTAETIGLAYSNYYTHQNTGTLSEGAISRFRRGIADSYANKEFRTQFPGGILFGYVFAWFLPRLRRYLDVRYGRHLPKAESANRRLLDVGCGNGEFLACATAMGWIAEGIDVDSVAIDVAKTAGYAAKQAKLDDPSLKDGSYDQITMSHVIEHMELPHEQLKKCLDLLAPGGRLWLQTPNIDSLGHTVFQGAWRGLEPPRHLMLFNRSALQKLLMNIGFVNIEFKSQPAVPLFIWEESRQIFQRIRLAREDGVISRLMRTLPMAVFADYWSLIRPDSAEFLTCTAFRPVKQNTSDEAT